MKHTKASVDRVGELRKVIKQLAETMAALHPETAFECGRIVGAIDAPSLGASRVKPKGGR